LLQKKITRTRTNETFFFEENIGLGLLKAAYVAIQRWNRSIYQGHRSMVKVTMVFTCVFFCVHRARYCVYPRAV